MKLDLYKLFSFCTCNPNLFRLCLPCLVKLFCESLYSVLCLGQDVWGTQVSLYLNFRGTFTNSGGHTKSFKFLPAKLNSYPEISVHFLFKFELDVDRFGSRRGVDDSEVVSAGAPVLKSPANLLFLY